MKVDQYGAGWTKNIRLELTLTRTQTTNLESDPSYTSTVINTQLATILRIALFTGAVISGEGIKGEKKLTSDLSLLLQCLSGILLSSIVLLGEVVENSTGL